MKIVWSPRVVAEIGDHVAFIAQDSEKAAVEWADDLFRRVEALLEFPEIGRSSAKGGARGIRRSSSIPTSSSPTKSASGRSRFWRSSKLRKDTDWVLEKLGSVIAVSFSGVICLPGYGFGPLFEGFAPMTLFSEEFRMRRPHLFFWFLTIALAVSAQEPKLPAVAVLPFTSRVLDSSAIDGLTSAMNSELINTGKFRVMERSQMDGILKEQGFQQSGACDGQECAVQVGKLLSVDQMVLGTIAKVGNTYTLSARLVDVQTGEVLKSLTRNSRAEVDAILTDIIPQVARDLAGCRKARHPDTAAHRGRATRPDPGSTTSCRPSRTGARSQIQR